MGLKLRIADPALFVMIVIATVLGVFFIFDAGYPREIARGGVLPQDVRNQLLALPFAFLAYWAASKLTPEAWERISKLVWVVAFFALFLVYVPGLGKPMNGAWRWIQLPGLPAIQPAEFVKFAVILYLSAVLARRQPWKPKPGRDMFERMDRNLLPWLGRLMPAAWVGLAVVVIEKEPDLGTAAIVAAVAFLMFVAGGVRFKSILVAGCLMAGLVGWLVTHESYRLARFDAHAHRWEADNIDEIGYQTVQSELGMAQGGLLGVGPGGGRAKHVMPAATTDFMLATIAEEFGLVGAVAVLGLLAAISFRLLKLAEQATNRFGSLVLIGAASWLFVQTGVNVLMANGTVPAIGIPLPFISYGGSSLVALWMTLGVCNAVLLPQPERSEVRSAVSGHRRWHGRPRFSGA